MTITIIKFKVTYKPSRSWIAFNEIGLIYNSMTSDFYVRIPGSRELYDDKITIYHKTYRHIFKIRSNRKEYVRKERILIKQLKGKT